MPAEAQDTDDTFNMCTCGGQYRTLEMYSFTRSAGIKNGKLTGELEK